MIDRGNFSGFCFIKMQDLRNLKTVQAIIFTFAAIEVQLQLRLCYCLVDAEEPLPVRTFSGSVDLAYKLGIISRQLRKNLKLIGEIRNNCIHMKAKKQTEHSWVIGFD